MSNYANIDLKEAEKGVKSRLELLDYLAAYLKCYCLSELRDIQITAEHADEIRRMPEDVFPLESYTEAADYLWQKHEACESTSEAKKRIIQKLLSEKDRPFGPKKDIK